MFSFIFYYESLVYHVNPLMPTVAIWYSYKASCCARPG